MDEDMKSSCLIYQHIGLRVNRFRYRYMPLSESPHVLYVAAHHTVDIQDLTSLHFFLLFHESTPWIRNVLRFAAFCRKDDGAQTHRGSTIFCTLLLYTFYLTLHCGIIWLDSYTVWDVYELNMFHFIKYLLSHEWNRGKSDFSVCMPLLPYDIIISWEINFFVPTVCSIFHWWFLMWCLILDSPPYSVSLPELSSCPCPGSHLCLLSIRL